MTTVTSTGKAEIEKIRVTITCPDCGLEHVVEQNEVALKEGTDG